MRTFSLKELATATNVSVETLGRWKRAGYLRPYSYRGLTTRHPMYRMVDFEDAAKRVKAALTPAEPTPTTTENTYEALEARFDRIYGTK